MNKIIGYTTGVFDLFHIGHLNVLKEAKKNCDYLIVGVTTDDEVKRIKGIETFIPFKERIEIVEALSFVDEVVAEDDTDKIKAWEELNYHRLFKGSDWKNSPDFQRYEKFFKQKNVAIKFFPYTKGTSSTYLRKILSRALKEEV